MYVTIDRFEGDYAVCEQEYRKMINIKKDKIPDGAKEGDILFIDGDCISIDYIKTKEQKAKIEFMSRDIWE